MTNPRVHATGSGRGSLACAGDAEVFPPVPIAYAERRVLFTYSCSYSLRNFARIGRQLDFRAVHVNADQARIEGLVDDVRGDLRKQPWSNALLVVA